MYRVIYFFYYVKELNLQKLNRFLAYASKVNAASNLKLMSDSIYSTFKYNISIMDYFYFRFFEKTPDQRKTYAGTGYMYEYQLLMNPKSSRVILLDKIQFLNIYKDFTLRMYASIKQIQTNSELTNILLNNSTGKLVVKNSKGQVGAEVEVITTKNFESEKLFSYMEQNNYDLIEEFIVQHDALMALSPSGLNTVRIITQLVNTEVIFVGARLRISVNSQVDNMAAGNAAAPIDMINGVITGPAVYSDITKEDFLFHPVTGVEIVGFQIPFWNEIIHMVKKAAVLRPENKSIGWDVAVRNDGVELVEGNHNWCKLLWQLPVKAGLKQELEKFKS